MGKSTALIRFEKDSSLMESLLDSQVFQLDQKAFRLDQTMNHFQTLLLVKKVSFTFRFGKNLKNRTIKNLSRNFEFLKALKR